MAGEIESEDIGAALRKQDHITLAFKSQISLNQIDNRFYYDPILAAHPKKEKTNFTFLGKQMNAPIWVSSMTGGTALARTINQNLARACGEYGLGMGLGSCRQLLDSDEFLEDFSVRKFVGNQPLFANLGIAQVEKILFRGEVHKIELLVRKLEADGLIIHVNPLQEWLQPEGDHISRAPIDTISELLQITDLKIIVKEVGQGMGYESLKALFQLPLEAIDFAANGGTNFALLELLRSDETKYKTFQDLAAVGHSADEMVGFTNMIINELGAKMKCKQVIISGGVKNFLDGYYYVHKIQLPAIYGQASSFLKFAQDKYESLQKYVESQLQGLAVAQCFLKVK
ncbi:MAG: type 2 isopentenyl-diphosphate Delta-isomerase [Cytophagales bacterium]|nr:MAG: type 2 isopentenyl-diphosphate Delta-isomerase [Cytophagales bacterium]